MSTPISAGAQVTRLLALVPYVLTRREVRLDEAAADLGATPEELLRDLNVLMFCGWPGYLPGDYIEVDLEALGVADDLEDEAEDSDGGLDEDLDEGEESRHAPDEVPGETSQPVIRVTNADYLARPLRLTVPEASALIVALRTLRESADEDVVPVVDRTLAKLEAAAQDGAVAAGRVDVLLAPEERKLGGLRRDLARAIAEGRQVRLTYYVPARDERTERVVDPLSVLSGEGSTGASYLDGWCHRAEDRRLFRLDRIEEAEVLDSPVDEHDLEPRDLSEGLFTPGEETTTAVLLLQRPARWVAEYYPVTRTTERDDGALEVELDVADPRWLQRLLLRLAPDAVLLSPQEFTEAFTAEARAALGLYRAGA